MTAIDAALRPVRVPRMDILRRDPAAQAFLLLRIAFTVAPILFGVDKFFNWSVHWPDYLAGWVNSIIPGSAQDFMHVVGGVGAVLPAFVFSVLSTAVPLHDDAAVALREDGSVPGHSRHLSLPRRRVPSP